MVQLRFCGKISFYYKIEKMWGSQKPETAFTYTLIGKKIGMFILKIKS